MLSVTDETTTSLLESSEIAKPLGRRLVDAGIISEHQLDVALQEQQQQGTYLGKTLVTLGFVGPDVLAGFLALDAQSRVFGENDWCIDLDVIRTVPYELARQFDILPLHRDQDTLMIAMAIPFNTVAIDALERATGLRTDAVAAPHQAIVNAIEQQYSRTGLIDDTMDVLTHGLEESDDDPQGVPAVIVLCNQIISLGIQRGASDIHVEPDESIVRVRMRVHGVLSQVLVIPKTVQLQLMECLKDMANLNISETRVPQTGTLVFHVEEKSVELAVSTLATPWGESLDMRILTKSSVRFPVSSLGLSTKDQKKFLSLAERTYGLVLVTGPSGSGKTSTIYAVLEHVNAKEKCVFTIEDPIEHRLSWVRQTQVNVALGMTFPVGLRALLRQEPEIVFVGEIRDSETADLATRAALTGSLVFSTMHANDAVGAMPRLIDLGVDPMRVANTVVAVIAQRLVRGICPECKVPHETPDRAFGRLNLARVKPNPLTLWRGAGCSTCAGSGYRGRHAIQEMFIVDDSCHDPIVHGPDVGKLRHLAQEGGMRSLLDDGFTKALQGLTTIEEVIRVTNE